MIALTLINRQENGYPARLSVLLPIWLFCCVGTSDCMRSLVPESPSWADARQKGDLSGVLRFSVIIRSTHPALSLCDKKEAPRYETPPYHSNMTVLRRIELPTPRLGNECSIRWAIGPTEHYSLYHLMRAISTSVWKKFLESANAGEKPKKAAKQLPSKTCSDSQKSVPKLTITHGQKASV